MALNATLTASIYDNQPKAVHVGNQSVSGKITTSARTLSDIMFLAKVPHGATIVDFYEYHTNGETAAVMTFGLNKGVVDGGAGNNSCLVGAGAVATMNRMSAGLWPATSNYPPVVSLSDADPVRYAALTAKCVSGTFTTSISIRYSLTYRMDGPARGGSEI
jgi:hypothetical protein